MLYVTILPMELWDETKEEFIGCNKEHTICLEHSLVSISKWESKWHKPFISKDPKTLEETIDYIKCMTISQNVDPLVYRCLSNKNYEEIDAYINDSMTATTFRDNKHGKKNREIITSEIIYFWMVALNIPLECQKWHLNKLLTLIRVVDEKNQPPKKMSKREVLSNNAALNAARRKQFKSKG